MGVGTAILNAVKSISRGVITFISVFFLFQCSGRRKRRHRRNEEDFDSDSEDEYSEGNIQGNNNSTTSMGKAGIEPGGKVCIDLTDDDKTNINITPREICSICLQKIKTPFTAYPCVQCHARHHAECQWEWYQYSEQGSTCPLCRSDTVNEALLKRLMSASREQKQYEKHIALLRHEKHIAFLRRQTVTEIKT